MFALAEDYKTLPITEVAGALLNHAETTARPERAAELGGEIQQYLDEATRKAKATRDLSAADMRFLKDARRRVSPEVYREIAAYYAERRPRAAR